VLEKGAAFAEAKKIEPSVLIGARLAPDMLPLSRQVGIATDVPRRGLARIAGVEAPSYEDTDSTFEALTGRIAKTLAFIETIPMSAIDGTEDKQITVPQGKTDVVWAGQKYLIGFILPNVVFHCATGYNILRHNGVEVGKRDFLGSF
jgi:hypothetical protein